jgi:hypothetical protein
MEQRMRRLLLCLPVCFVLIPDGQPRAESWCTIPELPPLREVVDDGAPLPDGAGMEHLTKTDPVAFLTNCLKRYDREVKGYRLTLQKQERIGGKLQRTEVTDIAFRETPFSVRMDWKEGARLAQRVLYVKGENNDKLLVKPAGLASFIVSLVERDVDGPDAKKSGRYPLTEFGIKIGMQRTLASWEDARKENALHIEYLGVQRIQELGNRPCYVLRRTGYKRPEDDGITDLKVYIDQETWLQTGSVLKGAERQLIGEYFFRDIHLNPDFKADTFTPEALRR